jgi:hypothetical protein
MPTDLTLIEETLQAFYDFSDKTVITIGAGGGGILEYARRARFVIAVDTDADAIDRLTTRVRACGLSGRFFMFHGDVMSLYLSGDVVLFEFSLHEMSDARAVLEHARTLAPEIVLMEHAPGSPWSWFAGEEDGVKECWAAVPSSAICRQRNIDAVQQFQGFAEVQMRLRDHRTRDARIARFRDEAPISIPMPCRIALLDSHGIAVARGGIAGPRRRSG